MCASWKPQNRQEKTKERGCYWWFQVPRKTNVDLMETSRGRCLSSRREAKVSRKDLIHKCLEDRKDFRLWELTLFAKLPDPWHVCKSFQNTLILAGNYKWCTNQLCFICCYSVKLSNRFWYSQGSGWQGKVTWCFLTPSNKSSAPPLK